MEARERATGEEVKEVRKETEVGMEEEVIRDKENTVIWEKAVVSGRKVMKSSGLWFLRSVKFLKRELNYCQKPAKKKVGFADSFVTT